MTELADRLSRHADLHEHQPWADDEQMQFARDLREAVGLIAELARLRAQVPVGWIGPSGFTHNTATNRMWMRESPKLAAKLSPVYAAPPAQPAEQQAQTVCKRTLIEIDARLRECSIVGASAADAYDTFYQHMVETALAAQPAEPIEARSRYETAYAGRQLPHTQTTTSEPVQRLSDAGIEALAGKHVGNSKLTRVDVISARRFRAKGETFQSIADRFSVDIKTIMAAIKGKQWSHVIDPAAPKATK